VWQVRVPRGGGVREFTIGRLDDKVYSFPGFNLYPIRGLRPPEDFFKPPHLANKLGKKINNNKDIFFWYERWEIAVVWVQALCLEAHE
jgi:hypothetical protein